MNNVMLISCKKRVQQSVPDISETMQATLNPYRAANQHSMLEQVKDKHNL